MNNAHLLPTRIKDPNPMVRLEACEQLNQIPNLSLDSVFALKRTLHDPDLDVVDAAHRVGISATGPMLALIKCWDIIGFRRGEVLTILIVGYPEGDEQPMQIENLACYLDERIQDPDETNLGSSTTASEMENRYESTFSPL